jgi:transposase
MMGDMSPETCWAIKKHWNNKFYYTVASCWFFLWDLMGDYFRGGEQLMLPKLVKNFPAFFGWSFVLKYRNDKKNLKRLESYLWNSPKTTVTTILLAVLSFDTCIHAHDAHTYVHTYIYTYK